MEVGNERQQTLTHWDRSGLRKGRLERWGGTEGEDFALIKL